MTKEQFDMFFLTIYYGNFIREYIEACENSKAYDDPMLPYARRLKEIGDNYGIGATIEEVRELYKKMGWTMR